MQAAARSALAAVAFLTRIPVARRIELGPDDVAAGAPFFPLVGGAVGAVCGLVADKLVPSLPSLVAGVLAIGLAALLTGAMHLDGLADTADALGATSRERALEIMRDHRVGAFGAVALIVVVLLDSAVVGTLAIHDDATVVFLGAAAAGRAVILPLVRVLPYARAAEGQGRILDGLSWTRIGVACVLAVALVVPAGVAGAAGLAAAVACALLFGLVARAWLGGITGDVLGATAKLAETAFLVTALAVVT